MLEQEMRELIRKERNEIENKIKELNIKLEHLEHIEKMVETYPIMEGKETPSPRPIEFPELPREFQKRRYTKNKNWTEIETKQLMDMVDRGYSTTKIATTLGMNRKRVLNKIYNLRREKRLFKPAGIERPRITKKHFKKGEREKAVLNIIDNMPNVFTIQNVVQRLQGIVGSSLYRNSGDLNQMISRLAKEKGIKQYLIKGRYVFKKHWNF